MTRVNKSYYYFFVLLIISSMLLSGCVKPVIKVTPSFTPYVDKTPVNKTDQVEENPKTTQTLDSTYESFINIDLGLLEGTQIEFMYPWVGKIDQTLLALINEFNKQNEWGIFVRGVSVGGAEPMFDILNEQIADGDLPDIIALNPFLIKRLDGETYWTDLSSYIDDPVWGIGKDELMDLPEVYLKQNQVGENILGFPFSLSASGLFYNVTWAQELGFQAPPTTPEELKQQLCKAAESKLSDYDIDNNGTGGLLLSRTPLSILSWYQSFRGTIPNGLSTAQFNDQFSSSAFSYVKTLFDENCAWVGRQSVPYDYFANRYTLVYEGKLEDILLQTEANSRNKNDDEWIMLPYPTLSGEGSIVVDAFSLAIPVAKPEVQLAAWIFMRWLTSSGVQITFTQSSGSWPVYSSTMQSMDEFISLFPQWDDLLPFPEIVEAGPSYSAWIVDKMVLEDAYWQYLQRDASALSDILVLLDETILELSEK